MGGIDENYRRKLTIGDVRGELAGEILGSLFECDTRPVGLYKPQG